MDLDTFIVTVFCIIDDMLPDVIGEQPLRKRGPKPKLSDSEVLTIEIVGEYLGLNQDNAMFQYFRRHFTHFFPALSQMHRTTFIRQAANLYSLKEALWQYLLLSIPHDPTLALVDSFPLPVCQFARAYRCRRFKGEAAYGKDILSRQTFYGFRIHVRLCWPGLISRFIIAPANVHELAAVPTLTENTKGFLIGDRNYWSPKLTFELSQHFIQLLAPFRKKSSDPNPSRSAALSRIRYPIDTVFGQLVQRCQVKQVWARDLWHLGSRLLRKVLMHSIAVWLNIQLDNKPLQLHKLVS